MLRGTSATTSNVLASSKDEGWCMVPQRGVSICGSSTHRELSAGRSEFVLALLRGMFLGTCSDVLDNVASDALDDKLYSGRAISAIQPLKMEGLSGACERLSSVLDALGCDDAGEGESATTERGRVKPRVGGGGRLGLRGGLFDAAVGICA